jgi:hypothetical protein
VILPGAAIIAARLQSPLPRDELLCRIKSLAAAKEPETEGGPRLPDFIKPQLCESVGRPQTDPDGLDGYRIQLRIENGRATPKDPQGSRLDREVWRYCQRRRPAARRDH